METGNKTIALNRENKAVLCCQKGSKPIPYVQTSEWGS